MRKGASSPVVGILFACECVAGARAAAGKVVRDRCIRAAEALPALGPSGPTTVRDALHALAPSGRWDVGRVDEKGAREVAYRAGQGTTIDWVWACNDSASLPSLVAISPAAQKLTPQRVPPP